MSVPRFEDVLMAHLELTRGAPFCANPACALHVRLQDAQVEGSGNWIALPDGRMFGRGRFGGWLLCDACGTRRGPVRVPVTSPQRLKVPLARQ
jgi:hypothetical protein